MYEMTPPGMGILNTISNMHALLELGKDPAKAATEFVDARDRFKAEQPRTFELIKSSTKKNSAISAIDYLVTGAAVEQQLEIDVLSYNN